MGRIISFNVTRLGASHVKSGKPCQDYSLSWDSQDDRDIHVAIVCDGHGGDTYVRSDRGSKFAAQIALSNIQELVECGSPHLILDNAGAVTARPEEEDDIFHSSGKTVPTAAADYGNDAEDSRKQQAEQNRQFEEAVAPIREQDQVMQRLFASIYTQWMAAITEDAQNDPFTDWEKSKLNGARIAKAYGTTLMAFVRTPLYWFAFHIGDGKMLCCDANFQWREPVPWDCNCFLNITTSLCLREPLHCFRYAFSGKGDFPTAVIMGSDGLDDSWVTMDNLKNFYSQTLSIFNDLQKEETVGQLGEYLPRLSEKGSRDDMSMAGIIDMDAIVAGAAVYKKRKELNALTKERKAQEENIAKLQQKFDLAAQEHTRIEANYQTEKAKETEILAKLKLIQPQVEELEQKLTDSSAKKAECETQLQEAKDTFATWFATAKEQKAQLEADYNQLSTEGDKIMQADLEAWAIRKATFEEAYEAGKRQRLEAKVANMQEQDEEAAKGIAEAIAEDERKAQEQKEKAEAEKAKAELQDSEQEGTDIPLEDSDESDQSDKSDTEESGDAASDSSLGDASGDNDLSNDEEVAKKEEAEEQGEDIGSDETTDAVVQISVQTTEIETVDQTTVFTEVKVEITEQTSDDESEQEEQK